MPGNNAIVMRRAALGPAALAARHSRLRGASTRGLSDARVMQFGALGLDPTAGKVVSSAASYGAAAVTGTGSTLAATVGYGAIAGPVGAVVGLVVGLVIGKLLNKQYLNVGQMNAAEAVEVTVYNQYKAVAGRAAGRAYGLAVMTEVWKGALHSGLFSLNNVKQCFHEGCSTYPGNASLIDIMINGGSSDANTFPDVYQKWQAGRTAATSTTPARAVTTTAPVAISPARAGIVIRGQMAGLGCGCNLGSLGAASAVPDAVTFIDNYFMPANAPGSKCSGTPCYWAYPRSAMEKQILYDVADAYLATKPVSTIPNGPTQGAASPPPTVPATAVATPVITPVPASGTQPAVNVIQTAAGSVAVPATSSVPAGTVAPVLTQPTYIMPDTGAVVPPGTPGAVVSPIAASLTSYLSNAGIWPWVIGGGLLLVLLKR